MARTRMTFIEEAKEVKSVTFIKPSFQVNSPIILLRGLNRFF